jgi:hypothetical protein
MVRICIGPVRVRYAFPVLKSEPRRRPELRYRSRNGCLEGRFLAWVSAYGFTVEFDAPGASDNLVARCCQDASPVRQT